LEEKTVNPPTTVNLTGGHRQIAIRHAFGGIGPR